MELIAAIPRQTIPFLVVTVVAQYFSKPFHEPLRPCAGARLQANIRQDLVGSLVRHGLGLQERRQTGLEQVSLGFLIEEDSIGEVFVISPNLRIDVFVIAEITFGGENDRNQGKLGRMHGEAMTAKGFDEPPVKVFEQTPAILGERQRRLIKDQVVLGFPQVIVGVGAFFLQQRLQLIGRVWLKRLNGGHEPGGETELAIGKNQGGRVGILAVQASDNAIAEFVTDLESLGRRGFRG